MMLPFPDSRYEVLISPDPAFLVFGFEPTLFNSPAYIALHPNGFHFSFYLKQKSTGKVKALCHLSLKDRDAISPYQAPFGSVETDPDITLLLTEDFIRTIVTHLREKGISQITIKHYPFCYAPNQSNLVINSLLYLNFSIELSQINHHLPVTSETFESKLHLSERRRLHKCRKYDFTFQAEPATFLSEAYAFIKACRIEKNKPLSLSETQLKQLFDQFPERYLIFSVRDQQKLAAITVAIMVRKDILLTFYPANPKDYNSFSPAVMLNDGLYTYCQANGIRMLDYGISGTASDPHYSLMNFKERLGGLPSLKLTFTSKLN